MTEIVLATRNQGKVRELAAMLKGRDVAVTSLADHPEIPEIPETGDTFLENARIKARAVAAATGKLAVADDSGIVVDALGGAPGVYSARYAGEACDDAANNAKLLAELADVPDERRTARFVSVIVATAPDGREVYAEGAWEGRIGYEPRGHNGFGYDPLFITASGLTGAELPPDAKNAQSHRGKALAGLLEKLPTLL